jgi:hypothetical protein
MSENDQEIYKDFNLVVSERWQAEISGRSILKMIVYFKVYNYIFKNLVFLFYFIL